MFSDLKAPSATPSLSKINDSFSIEVAGENALIIYFSENNPEPKDAHGKVKNDRASIITAAISNRIHQSVARIREQCASEVVDLIPSYSSILVVFNLFEIDHHRLKTKLRGVLQNSLSNTMTKGRLVELPAYYDLNVGVDLARIAKHANLTVKEVISLHQSQEYRVYAIGFAPGFAYLGEVDERIAMARLTTPRLKVPKGAIAIADRQTAVYPAQSPGGWNIIGSCPIDMFNAKEEPYMPISVGDRVKFKAIDKTQFLALGGELPADNLASNVIEGKNLK